MKALSNPVSARVMRNELKTMTGLFDTPGEKLPELLAPFLTSLLASAFAMNGTLQGFVNQGPVYDGVINYADNDGMVDLVVSAASSS